MKPESKSTPSRAKCEIGSKLTLKNAERHFQCALELSKLDEFGVAVQMVKKGFKIVASFSNEEQIEMSRDLKQQYKQILTNNLSHKFI